MPFARSSSALVALTAVLASSILLSAAPSQAQLNDNSQVTPNVPGGHISKSLGQQVGEGSGNDQKFGSAIYLIKRDPARAVRRGRQIFQRKFTLDQGLGPRIDRVSSGDIMLERALGAGLVDSCAGCHGRPRGSAGFGGDVVTRPDSRDAPHLFGLGLQEMLADEITKDLRAIRASAVSQALAQRKTITLELKSKGIAYGHIRARSDGSLDNSFIRGVDPDLRVKPFFAQGGTISMREFAIGAFRAEMGLESPDALLCAVTSPTAPRKRTSPAGFVFDPALDKFERPPVCSTSEDHDNDGIRNEINTALIDHMEFYLLNYFKPGIGKQTSRTQEGLQLMKAIRCTSCHIQHLTINRDRRVADVETVYDPVRGNFNRLFATASTLFEVVPDTARYPKLLPVEDPFVVKNIFTDFKRHDLGAALHEREYDGSMVRQMMTEALWGVGSTPPYGHDGRSINLEEVILRHGGEAQSAKESFARLDSNDRNKILEFLNTLILFPPDDTASNLNPGVPGSPNPQDPSQHGSINLGALFQIPEEGPE